MITSLAALVGANNDFLFNMLYILSMFPPSIILAFLVTGLQVNVGLHVTM